MPAGRRSTEKPTQRIAHSQLRPRRRHVENRGTKMMPSGRGAALLVPAFALAGLALVHARRRRRLRASSTRSEPEPQAAPPDPRAASHLRFGNLCTRAGKLEKALEHYAAALKLRPNSAAAHHNSASVCQRLNRFDDAIRHYEARTLARDRERAPRTGARIRRAPPHHTQLSARAHLRRTPRRPRSPSSQLSSRLRPTSRSRSSTPSARPMR